ncbi:MAG: hypothetical protein MHM6MM_002851 [Cercozoa sp. M6MM]
MENRLSAVIALVPLLLQVAIVIVSSAQIILWSKNDSPYERAMRQRWPKLLGLDEHEQRELNTVSQVTALVNDFTDSFFGLPDNAADSFFHAEFLSNSDPRVPEELHSRGQVPYVTVHTVFDDESPDNTTLLFSSQTRQARGIFDPSGDEAHVAAQTQFLKKASKLEALFTLRSVQLSSFTQLYWRRCDTSDEYVSLGRYTLLAALQLALSALSLAALLAIETGCFARVQRFTDSINRSDWRSSWRLVPQLWQGGEFSAWTLLDFVSDCANILGAVLYLTALSAGRAHSNDVTRFWTGLGCALSYVMLLDYTAKWSRTDTAFVQAMKKATPVFGRTLVSTMPLFLGFTVAGVMIFNSAGGGAINYSDNLFADFGTSMKTLFAVMNGDQVLESFFALTSYAPVWSRVYLYSFCFLFIFVILNVMVAQVEWFFFEVVKPQSEQVRQEHAEWHDKMRQLREESQSTTYDDETGGGGLTDALLQKRHGGTHSELQSPAQTQAAPFGIDDAHVA